MLHCFFCYSGLCGPPSFPHSPNRPPNHHCYTSFYQFYTLGTHYSWGYPNFVELPKTCYLDAQFVDNRTSFWTHTRGLNSQACIFPSNLKSSEEKVGLEQQIFSLQYLLAKSLSSTTVPTTYGSPAASTNNQRERTS